MTKYQNYNARDDIENIINRKKEYDDAGKIADEAERTARQTAAQEAAAGSYRNLEENGHADEAAGLRGSDQYGAHKFLDAYGKAGKVWSREYLPNAVEAAGIQYDPGKVRWDNDTQEVFYDGVNFGKADYVSSDGRSYFDPAALDEGVAKLKKPVDPVTDPFAQQYLKASEGELDLLNKRNFSESADGRNITKHFDWDGNIAGSDALASSAADNAGNADSFGGANYARAKQAFASAGEQAMNDRLEMYLSGYRDFMKNHETMSRTQQLNRDDAAKNEIEDRKQTDSEFRTNAEVTGQVGISYYYGSDNPYIKNGKAATWIPDYAAAIDKKDGNIESLREKLKDPNLSDTDRNRLEKALRSEEDDRNFLVAARNTKMNGSETAAQASGGRQIGFTQQQAEPGRQFDRTDDTNRYGIDIQKSIAQIEADADRYGWDAQTVIATIQAEAEKYGWDQQVVMANIDAITKKYQTDAKSNSGGVKSGETETKEPETKEPDGGVKLAATGAKNVTGNGNFSGETTSEKSGSSGEISAWIADYMSKNGLDFNAAVVAAEKVFGKDAVNAYLGSGNASW